MNGSYLRTARLAAMILLGALVFTACAPAPAPTAIPATAVPVATSAPVKKISALDFRNAVRKLWEDHITWTRLYIISIAHDLPDKDATTQRLLANQADIGNAIKAFYGDAAGDKLTALLKDHILGAADLLAAAKAGDQAKVDAASKKWYQNADDIAGFLNSANNKNWQLAAMKDAMKMHLDQTLKEAVDRLQGKYGDDIKDYDVVHAHILDMADVLSSGIMAQFPDKFDQNVNAKDMTLRLAMRKLWEDHITWTRLYIVSVANSLPDQDVTAQRLLANQTDIGNAIKAYYGDAAGNQLTALLKDHILGAADLLAAAKAGDQAKVDAASKKWYDNADAIAAFLNSANGKNWQLAAMKDAMKMHLDQTLKEAVDRLQGKYADDIKDYDVVHAHILDMADALSAGVLAQFPDKF